MLRNGKVCWEKKEDSVEKQEGMLGKEGREFWETCC